jgi:hypothetical protein
VWEKKFNKQLERIKGKESPKGANKPMAASHVVERIAERPMIQNG